MAAVKSNTLNNHLLALKNEERAFENAFEGISRMILDSEIEKVIVNGKTTYDFKIFREGKKHIVGMYDARSFVRERNISLVCMMKSTASCRT